MTPTEQAVERIKIALAYGDGTPLGDTYPLTHNMTAGDVSALLTALQALQTRVGELEGALKPFAEACNDSDDNSADDHTVAWESALAACVTFGDFRQAAALLTPPLEQE